jgi:hypothetical protein
MRSVATDRQNKIVLDVLPGASRCLEEQLLFRTSVDHQDFA